MVPIRRTGPAELRRRRLQRREAPSDPAAQGACGAPQSRALRSCLPSGRFLEEAQEGSVSQLRLTPRRSPRGWPFPLLAGCSSTGRARLCGPGPLAAPGSVLSTGPEPPSAPRRCAPERSAASAVFSLLARPTREIGPSRAGSPRPPLSAKRRSRAEDKRVPAFWFAVRLWSGPGTPQSPPGMIGPKLRIEEDLSPRLFQVLDRS